MKKTLGAVMLVLGIMIWLFPAHQAQATIVKWSQMPAMEQPMLAYDFASETKNPVSLVADDFMCTDERPVIAIRWWGSYWDTTYVGPQGAPFIYPPYPNSASWGDPAVVPPGTVLGFNILIYGDVPARQGIPPWSHPTTAPVYVEQLPLDQVLVKETFYGVINRQGVTETVFQYDAVLPVPFEQEEGTIYWLAIQAIDPNPTGALVPIQWGWHESVDHWNDNAVQSGYTNYAYWGWDLLPDKDMAFQLQVVPVPTTILLFGSGLLGLIGFRRRQNR